MNTDLTSPFQYNASSTPPYQHTTPRNYSPEPKSRRLFGLKNNQPIMPLLLDQTDDFAQREINSSKQTSPGHSYSINLIEEDNEPVTGGLITSSKESDLPTMTYSEFRKSVNVSNDMRSKELFEATNNLTSQVYKYINTKTLDQPCQTDLWCFVQAMQNYQTYPIDQLLQLKWVKSWWEMQSPRVQTTNFPYWRKALLKKCQYCFNRLPKDIPNYKKPEEQSKPTNHLKAASQNN